MTKPKLNKLVMMRHGESSWNLENRFTGWYDADLTPKGVQESRQAGIDLNAKGYTFDVAYTSRLQRAIKSFNGMADELNCHWIPLHKEWRLNERHYGALQGFNKQEMCDEHGED
jgi:2,3-bisphosphoglycerate-dependent phosphoglycerate mutase